MRPIDMAMRLAANAQVFQHLLAGVEPGQARWKPTPDKWSLLEVVNHLADEERDDFRMRIDLTLHHAGQPWPPINPPQWAVEREYHRRDLAESLGDFLRERTVSVEWLKGLEGESLAAEYRHPQRGIFTAGQLLVSWHAHDLLHIRQMARLHYEYLAATTTHSLRYAGDW